MATPFTEESGHDRLQRADRFLSNNPCFPIELNDGDWVGFEGYFLFELKHGDLHYRDEGHRQAEG